MKKRFLSFLLATVMLVGTVFTTTIVAEDNLYPDVALDRWSAADIAYVTEKGMMKDTGDGKFEPAKAVTRAMVVTVLHRMAGEPEYFNESKFTDVPEDQWYYEPVAWGAENRLVVGFSDSTFRPNDPVSREQLVTFIGRYAEMKDIAVNGEDLDGFSDSDKIQSYALEFFKWAVKLGLVKGVTVDEIRPSAGATREQFAAIIHRFDTSDELEYQDRPENVVIRSGEQALVLNERDDGTYLLQIFLVNGDDYIPFFDAEEELIKGIGYPSEYTVETINGNQTCIMKGGDKHSFTLTCTALESEGLFKFSLDIETGSVLKLENIDIAFTMTGDAEVTYGQMPISIYGNMWGYDNVGVGMPSAYLWDKGREAVILFDYTNMRWMTPEVYLPGRNGYVTGVSRDGNTVFGLCYGMTDSGVPVNSGIIMPHREILVEFYLYGGLSARKSGVDCIKTKASVMSSVHPTMVSYPTVREELKNTISLSWEKFADGTVTSLLNPLSYNEVEMNLSDPILSSESRSSKLYMSYARPSTERYIHTDYSCNNNWLASLSAYNRIKGNSSVADMVNSKMDALQFYYDPEANMIRWGFRYNNLVGPYEMSWQNLFYHTDIYRSSTHASNADFSPAALSSFLASLDGITELVEKSDYVLPQWIDPINKVPVIQNDVPELGYVYEPWQIGSYAYACLKGYEINGSQELIDLASTALTKVIEEVRYNVSNDVYTVEYKDSAEFPITELFGTANGVYASYRLFELTGEEKYLNYSEAFFGMLCQLTYWGDDNFTEKAESSTLLGLFEPHGGASHACPWESIEAILPLTEILNATGEYAFNDLILAMINCQRVSSFNFYPVTWSDDFSDRTAYTQEDFYYIPTEPLYNSIGGGNSDSGALYMSSLSLWNYLLYEAFGVVDNSEVMVLCTDIHSNFETAVRGAERNFVLYNPTDASVTVNFIQKELPDGNYNLTVEGKEGARYTADQLTSGVSFTIDGRSSMRLKLVSCDESRRIDANRDVMTKYRLAMAYNTVSEKVQLMARNNFAEIFSDADCVTLDALANYVCTYVTYEDAIANALSCETVDELMQLYSERAVATDASKKQYESADKYHLPDEYATLIKMIDKATVLFRDGAYEDAYDICDGIINAVADGTEIDLAKEWAESNAD